jgi:hypothetical protein
MAKLKLSGCMRLLLQAIAVIIGLAGLVFAIVMPIRVIPNTVQQISNGEIVSWGILFSFIGFAAIFLIGLYLIFVSYLVLAKFSVDAIEHICLLLAMCLFFFLSRLTVLFLGNNPDTSFFNALYGLALALAPIFLAVGFYRISKNICVKLTGVQISDNAEE